MASNASESIDYHSKKCPIDSAVVCINVLTVTFPVAMVLQDISPPNWLLPPLKAGPRYP